MARLRWHLVARWRYTHPVSGSATNLSAIYRPLWAIFTRHQQVWFGSFIKIHAAELISNVKIWWNLIWFEFDAEDDWRIARVLPVGLASKKLEDDQVDWKKLGGNANVLLRSRGIVQTETPQTTARGSGRSCLMKNLSTWLKSRLMFKFVGRGTPRDRTVGERRRKKKERKLPHFVKFLSFRSAVERRSSRISAAVCLFVSRAPHGVHYCDGISTPKSIDPRCCCCCFHLFLEGISMSNIWLSSCRMTRCSVANFGTLERSSVVGGFASNLNRIWIMMAIFCEVLNRVCICQRENDTKDGWEQSEGGRTMVL